MIKITAKGNTKANATKTDKIIKLLSRPNGISIDDIARAAEWQHHGVRGFISGTLRSKGITFASSREEGKVHRYKIVSGSIQ